MKQSTHPQYFDNSVTICSSCGTKYTIGSTKEEIHVELCSSCHPFYTGEQRFVDSASRIQKFQKKQEVASLHVTKKKEKEDTRKDNAPKTLREMLLEVQ